MKITWLHQESSNGEAMVSLHVLTRKLMVSPLTKKPIYYKGSGCYYTRCPFPERKCVECMKMKLTWLHQASSNGEAMVSLHVLTRRLMVSSLTKKPIYYKGSGCCYTRCPFPERKCVECLHRFGISVCF